VKQHAPLLVAREDAVEYEHMEVDVQVQAAESLNCEYRSAPCIVNPDAIRSGTVARKDRLDEDARQRGEHVGLERGESAKLVRKREDVLPQGHVRQDSIDQERRDACHAPAAAARADASTVARKGDEKIVAAGVAPDPGKAFRKVAALDVGPELLLDVTGQPTFVVRASVSDEALQIRADKLMENRLRRLAGKVCGRERGHEGCRTSRAACHDRRE
jgi:hypothetical protein